MNSWIAYIDLLSLVLRQVDKQASAGDYGLWLYQEKPH